MHFYDISHLLGILQQLRDAGNTVVVIEHNLDVIKTADWVIDLGPEGGEGGGQVVGVGTPEQIACVTGSWTGQYLAPLLGVGQAKLAAKKTGNGKPKPHQRAAKKTTANTRQTKARGRSRT